MLIAWDCVKKYCSSASRPVKPLPVGLSLFGSTALSRSLTFSSTKRRLRIGSVLTVPSSRSVLTVERACVTASTPVSDARPRPRTAGRAESANGPRRRSSVVRSGAAARRSASAGVCCVGGRAEVGQRRAQLAQERRQLADRSRRARCLRCADAVVVSPASLTKRATSPRLRATPASTRSASCVSCCRVWRLEARIFEHAIGLAQRRHGAADRRLEVVAARREARAELGQDQPEALARGAAQDVEHEVGRDRRGGLVDRDRLRRGLGRRAGLAVEVVLADQRLRLDLAEDVLAKAGELRPRDGDRDERAGRPALHVQALDAADRHARRAQVRADRQPEGVVEHDGVALLVARARDGRRQRRDRRGGDGREHEPEDDDAATEESTNAGHGPIGVWDRSQFRPGST